MAEPQESERDFQRWVVTSPWFQTLSDQLSLDTDELKALLAGKIFNDSTYDFRGMYQANLSPTITAGGRLSLPRTTASGSPLQSADSRIESFFSDRFGVGSEFFGPTPAAAVKTAAGFGLLPGFSIPFGDDGDDSGSDERNAALADSLTEFSRSPAAAPDFSGFGEAVSNAADAVTGGVADTLDFNVRDAFNEGNLTRMAGSGAASLAGSAVSKFAGPFAGGLANFALGGGAKQSLGQTIGGLIGLATPIPGGTILGSFLGGLFGDRLDDADSITAGGAKALAAPTQNTNLFTRATAQVTPVTRARLAPVFDPTRGDDQIAPTSRHGLATGTELFDDDGGFGGGASDGNEPGGRGNQTESGSFSSDF